MFTIRLPLRLSLGIPATPQARGVCMNAREEGDPVASAEKITGPPPLELPRSMRVIVWILAWAFFSLALTVALLLAL